MFGRMRAGLRCAHAAGGHAHAAPHLKALVQSMKRRCAALRARISKSETPVLPFGLHALLDFGIAGRPRRPGSIARALPGSGGGEQGPGSERATRGGGRLPGLTSSCVPSGNCRT